MSEKSIAILGKGPSVKKCTREFIDSFDEVAVCGRPVFSGYEKYVGTRAHYDFANRTSTPYTKEDERLGVLESFDTGSGSSLQKDFDYDDIDPSTGILAFHYFLKKPEYTKIALIGFDLFQTMEKMYYYKNEEFDPAVDWLWKDGTYDSEGRLTIVSGHDTKETHEYLNSMFEKYKEKQFYVISSYEFKEKENVKVL